MGLFDVIKQQGLNALQQGTDALNNLTGNQPAQQSSSSPSGMPPTPPAPAPAAPTQGDGIYGNYIEHLIDMALADGELTEKEKQVLFKKAEAMGIDLDEFEMVLDARLFEKQKAIQAPQPVAAGAAPKSDKYGDVKKCPSCGAMIVSFSTRCPDCGYEFRNIGAVSSISSLFEKLERVDEQKDGGFFTMMFSESKLSRKVQIIKAFPIPNTKEDLLEFLSMAAPLGKPKSMWSASENYETKSLRDAWREKCGQVIMKARFSMKDDPDTLAEIEKYAKELKIK